MNYAFLRTTAFASALLGASFAQASETAANAVMISEDLTVEKALTAASGDAASGREIFANRKLGNCLACHENDDLAELPFHGNVGPEMNGVADRYEPAMLRTILVDSKKIFGDETIMPSFYRIKNGARPAKKFDGKTILSAQQVEDVLAYLLTLKE
ncbi:MAG: sulfur oxidation c-type cytochrome SoxX [Hyphomicrobiales bacterium]